MEKSYNLFMIIISLIRRNIITSYNNKMFLMMIMICCCSIFLNLFLIINNYNNNNNNSVAWMKKMSWSKKACYEAEAVASLSCSGHGRAFLDGLVLDEHIGKPICECNACYTGPDCSQFLPDCVVDAESGNPIFMEPFWRENAEESAVVLGGWHRMGYEYGDGSLISKQVEKKIRKLHEFVGNAITDGKFIVFGAGSTQLLNAAVHALSSPAAAGSSPPAAKVVVSPPYYPIYKSQTELFKSVNYKFSGDTNSWLNNYYYNNESKIMNNFIEFVTSPGNPDGQLKKAVLDQGPFTKQIHDFAYYWPNYTPIPSAMDEDLMLFTLSKLTGHAGSRFGWALIKDKNVYEKMLKYVEDNTYGVSRETQLRVLKILDVLLQENGRKMFDFAYGTMKDRWSKLIEIFSSQKILSIQELVPYHCKFLNQTRIPTPAYVWAKCKKEEDKDCNGMLMSAAKIMGREGSAYGMDNKYVRLSIIRSQDDFDLLHHRLRTFLYTFRNTSSQDIYK